MVSKDHIDAMVTAALAAHYGRLSWYWQGTRYEVDYDNADAVGAMLWAENRRSIDYRYDESELEPVYTYERMPGRPPAPVVLKATGCYEYQSCETPDWRESQAYALCLALTHEYVSRVEGYDQAPWGIDDRAAFYTQTREVQA